MYLPPLSVIPVSETRRFLSWGNPLATVSIPESPILFPLRSRLCKKGKLLTIILQERAVRKLFLLSNSLNFLKQLIRGTSLMRS